ncbi:hypothetical protein MVEN_02246200 [Mycena venus]|uniref:F-box domain-containing protein n=1 Tax=Mycena venus TaxID=2733690 RepID=A0A8H7CGD6_9AGAR|nr:hypothetical protein MVEN_02246200 [Mycena venus]
MALSSTLAIQPRFSDEIILEIFEHLTDEDLLSLAAISKHIHDLALLAHLSRHGITETDIESNSFPQLSTSGAFRALRLARFITSIDSLRLRFEPSTRFVRDVAALSTLARRMPPIKSIDLEFSPWPRTGGRKCDIEGLLLDLISSYRSRPAITVSPLTVSIARPRKPTANPIRRLFVGLRSYLSTKYVPTEPTIDEEQFREGLLIFALLRLGGLVPSVSIRTFDAPTPIGSLIVLRAAGISDLRFPSSLRLSQEEMSALLTHLKLPLLRSIEVASSSISEPALHSFLCQHPTLEGLRLRGQGKGRFPEPPPAPLPSNAIPKLEHVLGSARLLAWILSSPQPFPHLGVATIELYSGPGMRDDYRTALRGLARQPTADTLAVQLKGWAPWNAPDFASPTAPERALPRVTDLRLTFRIPSRLPRGMVLIEWLRLFGGLQQVALFDIVPLENVCVLLRREFPNIRFTPYTLKSIW